MSAKKTLYAARRDKQWRQALKKLKEKRGWLTKRIATAELNKNQEEVAYFTEQLKLTVEKIREAGG